MTTKKATVLVVDDQTTVIRVMERMLSDEYIVLTAKSGAAALEIARGKRPDLILLDMVMPEMNGIQVCKHLRKDPLTASIPVIFVTSMDDRHNEETGFRAGAVDYISKPPSPGIVRARINVHLEKNRQARFIQAIATGYLNDPEKIREEAKALIAIVD
ncbi:MAG: putative two-component system response regulator [Candidatus Azotimanducaceae bacterium]|jgi:putative two-component system response regulator